MKHNTAQNEHRVPAKQWRKWSPRARKLFNDVYEDIRGIGNIFCHPRTVERHLLPEELDTIAWNAAWTAAGLLDRPGKKTTEVVTVDLEPRAA